MSKNKMKTANTKIILLIIIFSFLTMLPSLNSESGYAVKGEYRWTLPTVVETFVTSDWLLPKLDGNPRFRKPPFAYWLMVSSSKIFGLSLFSVRLPIILLSASAVMLFYLFLFSLGVSRKRMLAGAAMLLGSWGYYSYSRSAALEVPMLFFTLLVFYGFSRFFIQGERDGILLAAAGAACTLMTKSHATFISSIIFILTWAAYYRQWDYLLKNRRTLLTGAVILLVIVLPWYLYVYFNYSSIFVDMMKKELVEERVGRHQFHFFRMLSGIFTLILPYSLLLAVSLLKAVRNRNREISFLIIAIISLAVPYLFVNSHRLRYMVPMIPMFVAFIALSYQSEDRLFMVAMKVTAAVILLFGLYALAVFSRIGILAIGQQIIPLAVLILASVYFYKAKLLPAAISSVLLSFVFLGLVYPKMGLAHVSDDMANIMHDKDYATFDREPYYLSVKLKRPPEIDIKDSNSFSYAAKNGLYIYVPEKELETLDQYMRETGYSSYSTFMELKRYREYPHNSHMKNAVKNMDLDKMKERAFIVGDFK